METKVCDLGIVNDEELKFAVIVSKFNEKFVYVRHKERETYDKSYGRLYYSEIEELGELPDLEIQEIALFEDMPENLTYPQIHPILLDEVIKEINRESCI